MPGVDFHWCSVLGAPDVVASSGMQFLVLGLVVIWAVVVLVLGRGWRRRSSRRFGFARRWLFVFRTLHVDIGGARIGALRLDIGGVLLEGFPATFLGSVLGPTGIGRRGISTLGGLLAFLARPPGPIVMLPGRRRGRWYGLVVEIKGIRGHAFLVETPIAILAGLGGMGIGLLLLLLHLPTQFGQADLLVVFGSTRGIGQQLVGMLDALELILGVVAKGVVFDLVGMALEHEFAMGGFDLGERGIGEEAEDGVGVDIHCIDWIEGREGENEREEGVRL